MASGSNTPRSKDQLTSDLDEIMGGFGTGPGQTEAPQNVSKQVEEIRQQLQVGTTIELDALQTISNQVEQLRRTVEESRRGSTGGGKSNR